MSKAELKKLGRRVHGRLPAPVREHTRPVIRQVLSYPLNRRHNLPDRLVESPVFVICSVRSGSTLLRVLLDSHSQIHAPHEMHLRSIHVEFSRKYAEKSVTALGLTSKDLEHLLWDRMLAHELQQSGKRVIVDKTPANASFWPRLVECWPSARFIFLLRHPGSIYASFQAIRPKVSREDNIRHIHTYLKDIDKARKNLRGHTVRYEDLTADPARTARDLCLFLGVRWEPDMLNYGDHDHGKYSVGIGDWREKIKSGKVQPAGELPTLEETPEDLREHVRRWGYASG